jgi:beta-lactamase class A
MSALLMSDVRVSAQPIHGNHEPRSYDEGLIPRFSLELIELDVRGTLGVAVLDTESGKLSTWRASDRFPLNSTVKFLLCAAVLMRVDAGEEDLARPLAVEAEDVVAHSPVLETRVGARMTVEELCHAAMTQSDNGAANLLLDTVGGPEGLTALLRGSGDEVTRIDRWEPELNDGPPGDERDSTTPMAMLESLERFLLGPALSEASRETLIGWMVANATGDERIRAGVPQGWIVGDRTGTGPEGSTSDIAILFPPGRRPVLFVVYISGSTLGAAEASAFHAELARIATQNVKLDAEGYFD